MEYIKDLDYQYISQKYHAPDVTDDSNRFGRRDELFAEDTGLSGEEILKGILSEDEIHSSLPHPIRKAKALALVLKNTRISCDNRDRFPAINMIDRPLNATIIRQWNHEVFQQRIPEVEKKRAFLEKEGIVTIWPDYDHSVPYWDRVLALGFTGILAESERIRREKLRPETLDTGKTSDTTFSDSQDAFYEGIKQTYEAILVFIGRLAKQAHNTPGSERMAIALDNLKHRAPDTFYEALLTVYLYFMISEHIDSLQVRSLSNFDRLFYPFYQKDLDRGVPEEEIRADLAYFFLQYTAIGNYWNQPVFLGGVKENGETEINELSYLFLDVYDRMNIFNPKIQLKVSENTPKDFLLKALDMIRRGNNCIVFVCEETVRKALMNHGASAEQARLANITGCYEFSTQCSFGTGMNYLNLLKPLEYALHEGCDGVTGHFSGNKSPAPETYASFDQLYTEYKKQLETLILTTIEIVNGFEDYLSEINPLSMLSATFPSCLEQAKDAIGGGAVRNGSNLMCGFLADLADSLAMLKKYVYDKKEITLTDWIHMLDTNYEGQEMFRRRLRADRDKFGNNKDLPDSIAVDISDFIADTVKGKKNAPLRGGSWSCGFHVARMSYTQGEKTAASPNGRLLGEELSKNSSASMGQNREGATAAILSTTKLHTDSFGSDSCLDLGLLPSAVQGEDGLEAMYGLLRTFTKRGGHAMHINVFNADMLRDAQAHPEKYQDLQIRVCGWNVLWNNINKKEQDGFILQAESLI